MTSSLRARAAIGLAALLLAGLLAGCDEEDPADAAPSGDGPSAPQSSAPSEPASTATGPVEPTMPAEAEAETKAGAKAFLEYYWDVVNYAQATGDTAPLKTLSIASCVGCNGGIQSIDRIYQRGGRIVGGRNQVVATELSPKPSGGWAATQTIRVSRQRIRGAGSLDQVSAPGRVDLVLGVSYQDNAWLVTSLDV